MQNGGKRKEEGRMMNADSRMWKEEGGSRMQNVSAPQDSGGPHLRRCAKKQWRRGCDGRHAIGADEARHRMHSFFLTNPAGK